MSRQSKKRRKKEEAEREELLAPDAFEAQGATWSSWFEKNIKLIIAGVVGVLLLIVAVELVRSGGEATAAENTRDLIDGVDAYGEAVSLQTAFTATTAEAMAQIYREAREKLEPAIEGAGDPPLKSVAKLYDADLARRLEDWDAAIAGYDAYLQAAGPDDALRFFALEGKGYALEGKGDLDAALAVFETLASSDRYADYGLKHVARVLVAKDDPEGAKAAYEKIAAREPASPLQSFAEEQLSLLE